MSEQNRNVLFNGENLFVTKSHYSSRPSRIKLQLFDEEGYPALTATKAINEKLTTIDKDKQHTLIKNYSENEGILQALVDAKIVEATEVVVNVGFEKLHVVKVLI